VDGETPFTYQNMNILTGYRYLAEVVGKSESWLIIGKTEQKITAEVLFKC
jgi:hypothetical protein